MLADQTDGKTDIHLPIRLVDKVALALDLCLAEMQVLHYRASSDAARQIEQAYRFGNPVLADARRRAKSVRESAGFYDKGPSPAALPGWFGTSPQAITGEVRFQLQ